MKYQNDISDDNDDDDQHSILRYTVYIFSDLLVYNDLMYLFCFKIFLLFSFIHKLRCIELHYILLNFSTLFANVEEEKKNAV